MTKNNKTSVVTNGPSQVKEGLQNKMDALMGQKIVGPKITTIKK